MEIRKILKSDIEELSNLMMSVYNEPPWNDNWTKKAAYKSLNTILEFPTFYGNLIKDNNKIIGAIMGYTRMYSRETTYYIIEFFVSSKYRRKGFATSLYKFSIDDLKNKGISGAFFTTLKNTEAYKFYIKQGAVDLNSSACFYHRFD